MPDITTDDTVDGQPKRDLVSVQVVTHANPQGGHETIIHALNRWMTYENGRRIYFDVTNFAGTESGWNTVPAVYATRHPDGRLIESGRLDDALKDVGGTICGSHSDAAIVKTGQPRLTIKTVFSDERVQALYDQGKLSLSSAFLCNVGDDGRIQGSIKPNHILYFEPSDSFGPRDPSAMLLNLEEYDMTDNSPEGQVKSAFETVVNFLKSKVPDVKDEEETNMDTELKNQVGALEVELTNAKKQVEERDTQITALTEELTNTKSELEGLRKERADAEWLEVKNQLPTGMLHGEGKEEELRNAYEKDTKSFLKSVLAVKTTTPPTKEEGEEFTHGSVESDQIYDEFMESTGRR